MRGEFIMDDYHLHDRRCAICKKRKDKYHVKYNKRIHSDENWICDDCIKKIKELIDSH